MDVADATARSAATDDSLEKSFKVKRFRVSSLPRKLTAICQALLKPYN